MVPEISRMASLKSCREKPSEGTSGETPTVGTSSDISAGATPSGKVSTICLLFTKYLVLEKISRLYFSSKGLVPV